MRFNIVGTYLLCLESNSFGMTVFRILVLKGIRVNDAVNLIGFAVLGFMH